MHLCVNVCVCETMLAMDSFLSLNFVTFSRLKDLSLENQFVMRKFKQTHKYIRKINKSR